MQEGDSLKAWTGRKVEITVDRVLRARGKTMKNKAYGRSDYLVTEMLQEIPMESVYEITLDASTNTYRKRCKDVTVFCN